MEDYQKRMLDELEDLKYKISKLSLKLDDSKFMESLGNLKSIYLIEQFKAMSDYLNCLEKRVKLEKINITATSTKEKDESFPCLYTKKPVKIKAIKWTGSNLNSVISFVGGNLIVENSYDYNSLDNHIYLSIKTLEGLMRVSLGDYIIQGVQGEFYPCKPDIFKSTYTKV